MLKLSAFLLASGSALAAQQTPAAHLINTPEASSKQTLGLVAAVRQLPNGRLLVNDIVKRQLLMFDPTLATATVIADSASGGTNSYGPSAGAIVGYFGDSTLFIDPRDLSMFVIDPTGVIARVAAVPRSQDAPMLGSNLVGSPALDAKGRLVYRAGIGRMMRVAGATGFTMPEIPDSSAIVRIDLTSRKVDTVAYFKIPKTKMNVVQSDKGISMTSEINPMPLVDDWAVLADGSIAILRGQDYHIDWVNTDGSITTSPKLTFDWQRLSDEDKVAVIDSAKAAAERARTAPPGTAGSPGSGGGEQRIVMNFGSVGGGGGGGGATDGAKRGGDGPAASGPSLTFISPSDLPDYRPVFSQGAAKADLDGNLWIRTTATRNGAIAGPIYDVVNRKGEIIDRVQVPSGRLVVGFAKGGVVYMMARDDKGSWIERTHR